MIIVTGGAGFVGSNIIAALNTRGIDDILVVDHMADGRKMHNLADLNIRDYLDRADFLEAVRRGRDFGKVEAVFHEGACSDTTNWDGEFIMRNNFEYSKVLLHWCQQIEAQFLYASSASVYGRGESGFREVRACEHPLNMYAYSKFQFDQYVRSLRGTLKHQVVGLRYFNVYGPRESHKRAMASMPLQLNRQILDGGVARLFRGSEEYADGEQQRDFVYIDDCVAVKLWFFERPEKSGIFNLGSGRAQTFNDLARAVIRWHGAGKIGYVPFPEALKGSYQCHTQADLARLRAAGYEARFHSLDEGVPKYLDWLNADRFRRTAIEQISTPAAT